MRLRKLVAFFDMSEISEMMIQRGLDPLESVPKLIEYRLNRSMGLLTPTQNQPSWSVDYDVYAESTVYYIARLCIINRLHKVETRMVNHDLIVKVTPWERI